MMCFTVTQDIKDVTFALSEDGTPLLDPDDDEFVIYDASLAWETSLVWKWSSYYLISS